VHATELTEEQTTEEVTVEESELTLPEINENTIEEAKTWVVGALISLLTVMTSSLVVGIIMNKLKTKALGEVNKAVENNAISQRQADSAVNTINDTSRKMQEHLNGFSDKLSDKIDGFAEKFGELDDKLEKINTVLFNFTEAINEYLIDEDEV
jgi:uncharacterized phage infection (PIP) family protein YhgE